MNDAMENTEISLMLDIAHEAIRNRAARDDKYDAKTYDDEHDPEGYITSLLTSLRHWCHRHGIDWETELIVSEEHLQPGLRSSRSEHHQADPARCARPVLSGMWPQRRLLH